MKYLIFTLFLLFAIGCGGALYNDTVSVKDELVSFDFRDCKTFDDLTPDAKARVMGTHLFSSNLEGDYEVCAVDEGYHLGIYVIGRNFESYCDQNESCLEARKSHEDHEKNYPSLPKGIHVSKENVFIIFNVGIYPKWSNTKVTRGEIIEIFRKDLNPDVIR